MKILIADDDEVTRAALAAALQRMSYEVVACEDGAQAWDALQAEDAPGIAILDWMMPAPDGVEICRRLRAQDRTPYQYVILLTARGRAADVTQGFEGGADDYLRKPLDLRELRARLTRAERVLLLKDEPRARATVDDLTGLLNGAGIRERLQHHLDESVRGGAPLSVIVTDLSDVEALDRAHGQAIGDELLRGTAWRLTSHLRPYDVLGRTGRAEFLAILPGCARAEALIIAERMRGALDEPLETPAGTIRAAARAGAATADGAAVLDVDALLAAADAELYRPRRAD